MSKFAIIETGGKQYKVQKDSRIMTEKIKGKKEGDLIVIDKVLLKGDDTNVVIGKPYIEGATVKGEIKKEGRLKKILVTKFKNKTNYFKRKGHRQHFVQLQITDIN